MTQVIAFHSFRRGAGTSTVLVNCAAILAAQGKRVGIIDTDFQSPSAHILLGLSSERLKKSLNDYLWDGGRLRDVVYDVTPAAVSGKIYLAPASSDMDAIMRVLHEGYDAVKLSKVFTELSKELELDVLMVDTNAGLSEETLVILAMADILMLLLRLDKQDYQGTAVIASLAERLSVPRMELIVNHVPGKFEIEDVRQEVENKYRNKVAAVFPYTEPLLALASQSIFALQYATHPLTLALKELTDTFKP